MLAVTAELEMAKTEISRLQAKVENLETELQKEQKRKLFGIDVVVESEKNSKKNLCVYYTGLTLVRFMSLFTFLLPKRETLTYDENRNDIREMSAENGLFLTMCRLRQNFGLFDLATRFGISQQSAGIVFNTWIDIIYLKLCTVSIWPHRQTIIDNMPKDFKANFPTTLIIIDGTELKTESPWAHGVQCQLYSDYKSTTTFKALIGCDSRGSFMFTSELFTGSISDKAITKASGFYETIQQLKDVGYIQNGDGVMADKGFTIKDEINALGLSLNIPPFASADKQLSQADLALTDKIARHRVHVERLISRIKDFKIVGCTIPAILFPKLNRIWAVCCYLTLFQGFVLKKM
ncbi:uncharacterized protein LOC118556867 [Fundulus heteroclitus]|uniref:uncharacterized protein LOC118556867 n=1 Tax=Fundulus heteroclitus TaxID=8078 RepID=UPI00165C99B7|nr:uncharacterized protein LOC118556867 [Fundulus heteroclitus]